MELLKTEATNKLLGELVNKFTETLMSKEEKEKSIEQIERSFVNNKKSLSELESQVSELKSIIN
ncbi:MAG: hypothetical protein SOX94_06335 [Prevotella sp.]|nr:hypothetical protein [Prevotella sp.]